MDLMIKESITIRKQSLHERYNSNAVNFMRKILSDQMSNQLSNKINAADNFTSVFIQDSTRFKVPNHLQNIYPGFTNWAGKNAGISIQFAYDIKQQTIHHLAIDNALCRDTLYACELDWIKKDSLLIRDLGYYSGEGIKAIKEKEAYYLSRLQPKTLLFEKKGNEYLQINMKSLQTYMKKNRIAYLDKELYISAAKIPTRVCLFLVPEHVKEQRLRKNKRINDSKNSSSTQAFNIWSSFNVFITNVDCVKLSAKEISDLYKIRWQVELIFKTWKSYYDIDKVKIMKLERTLCGFYASLIYFLIHWKIYRISLFIFNKQPISWQKFSKLMHASSFKLRCIFSKNRGLIKPIIELLKEIDINIIVLEKRKGKISSTEILQYF